MRQSALAETHRGLELTENHLKDGNAKTEIKVYDGVATLPRGGDLSR